MSFSKPIIAIGAEHSLTDDNLMADYFRALSVHRIIKLIAETNTFHRWY